jgi:putative transposase
MEVLGAIDIVEGRTRHERIHNVAQMMFFDEEGDRLKDQLCAENDVF